MVFKSIAVGGESARDDTKQSRDIPVAMCDMCVMCVCATTTTAIDPLRSYPIRSDRAVSEIHRRGLKSTNETVWGGGCAALRCAPGGSFGDTKQRVPACLPARPPTGRRWEVLAVSVVVVRGGGSAGSPTRPERTPARGGRPGRPPSGPGRRRNRNPGRGTGTRST